MRPIYLSCTDFANAGFDFICCSSCHDEFDEGYCNPLEYYPSDVDRKHMNSRFVTWVCCSCPEPKTIEDWSRVVNAYRKRKKLEAKD